METIRFKNVAKLFLLVIAVGLIAVVIPNTRSEQIDGELYEFDSEAVYYELENDLVDGGFEELPDELEELPYVSDEFEEAEVVETDYTEPEEVYVSAESPDEATGDEYEFDVEEMEEGSGYIGIMPSLQDLGDRTVMVANVAGGTNPVPGPPEPHPNHFTVNVAASMGNLPNTSDTLYNASVNYVPPLGWYIESWNVAYQMQCLTTFNLHLVRGGELSDFEIPADRFGGVFTTGLSRTQFGDDLDLYWWLTEPTFSFRIRPLPPSIDKASIIVYPPGAASLPGDGIVEYVITVENPAIGRGPFNNFFFEDIVPAGLEPIAETLVVYPNVADGGVSISGNTVNGVLNLPSATPEDPSVVEIRFQARVVDRYLSDDGEFVNTVCLYDPDRELIGCDSERVPVDLPEIRIDKSVDPDVVSAGNDLEYTLVVTNTGNVTLNNVIVTDTLEAVLPHLALLDGTEQVTIVFSDGRAPTTTTLTELMSNTGHNIGTLGVGVYATLTFTVTVSEVTYGGTVLNNTATVEGRSANNETVEDDDNATTTVIAEPGISIDKAVDPAVVRAGDDLEYSLFVRNTGNVTLRNVIVRDPFTTILPHLALTGTEQVTIEFSDDRASTTITLTELKDGYDIGSLGVGVSAMLTFTVTVAEGVYGGTILDNIATAVGTSPDNEIVNDYDNARTTVADDSALLRGTVTCVVTGRPIPGVTVYLYDENGNVMSYRITDGNGEFDFGEVPIGNLEVVIDQNTIPYGYSVYGIDRIPVTARPGEVYDVEFFVTPPSPSIIKTAIPALPATVNPGGVVTYTFTIDTDSMMGTYNDRFTTYAGEHPTYFLQLEVVDVLHNLLTFNAGSLTVTGLSSFDYSFNPATRALIVYNMLLEGNAQAGYATEVVITFTATVAANAPAGNIANTVVLNNASTGETIGEDDADVTVVVPGSTRPPLLPQTGATVGATVLVGLALASLGVGIAKKKK